MDKIYTSKAYLLIRETVQPVIKIVDPDTNCFDSTQFTTYVTLDKSPILCVSSTGKMEIMIIISNSECYCKD